MLLKRPILPMHQAYLFHQLRKEQCLRKPLHGNYRGIKDAMRGLMKDIPNQISTASKAPAVPGAKGEKPEPKPVPMITGKKEGFFIDKK